MKEEGYIRDKAGSRNPFRVPDGYFDSLASQVMDKLPEREPVSVPLHRSRLRILRPLFYAAACVCVAVFCLAVYFKAGTPTAESGDDSSLTASQYQNYIPVSTYEDDIIDCAMMDNTDIYAYLSGEH